MSEQDQSVISEGPIVRKGCPPLNVWDIVITTYAGRSASFVVVPQGQGDGVAVRLLHCGNLSSGLWILFPSHFVRDWAVAGKYTGPENTPSRRRWWDVFRWFSKWFSK
jgi:hypothetical protein